MAGLEGESGLSDCFIQQRRTMRLEDKKEEEKEKSPQGQAVRLFKQVG